MERERMGAGTCSWCGGSSRGVHRRWVGCSCFTCVSAGCGCGCGLAVYLHRVVGRAGTMGVSGERRGNRLGLGRCVEGASEGEGGGLRKRAVPQQCIGTG